MQFGKAVAAAIDSVESWIFGSIQLYQQIFAAGQLEEQGLRAYAQLGQPAVAAVKIPQLFVVGNIQLFDGVAAAGE